MEPINQVILAFSVAFLVVVGYFAYQAFSKEEVVPVPEDTSVIIEVEERPSDECPNNKCKG